MAIMAIMAILLIVMGAKSRFNPPQAENESDHQLAYKGLMRVISRVRHQPYSNSSMRRICFASCETESAENHGRKNNPRIRGNRRAWRAWGDAKGKSWGLRGPKGE